MPIPGNSAAVGALGLGDLLGEQVTGETEEQRRKRMQQQQLQQSMGPSGSLAVNSLGLGGGGALT